MMTFLWRRLISGFVALVGVLVIVFFLGRLTGTPAHLYLPEGASPAAIEQFNATHGFDQPVLQQFFNFVGDALRLDFGQSLWQQQPAMTVILSVLPQTLLLAFIAILIALLIAVPLGCQAAANRFGLVDRAITFVSLAAASIPDFWFALLGILFFAVRLNWIPTSGQSGVASWILPVATLCLAPVGVLTQVVRGAMLDSLGAGYLMNARARGFTRRRLIYRHALRNAALPIITVAGDRAVTLVNGAIIVGVVFAWPSIGPVLVDAVFNRDFAVLQAGVFAIGVCIVVLNLLIDLTYALADARVRVS
jgi:peptide/nickel transport system permease protein